jgi:HAD superfamily hydrolase (TIGR01458 family)
MDALLLDLSGVLFESDSPVAGAREAVQRAQDSGLELRFVTNTSQKSRADLLRHLHRLGFCLDEAQLFTAVDAARQWLESRKLQPYCVVHDNIAEEFAAFDQNDANAVLIADAAECFSYSKLNRAFQLCMAGAPLLGVGYNRYFKSGDALQMDAGAFIRAVEFAADVKATIVGKPSTAFFDQVMASITADKSRTLMIGDDVYGDVEGALNAGINACLVRTGKYRVGDEDRVEGEFTVATSVVEAVNSVLGSPLLRGR